jgi:hypothetical protein
MPQPRKHTAGGAGKTTSRTSAEIVSAEKNRGSKMASTGTGDNRTAITRRSKILEHRTPTPLSGAPVNTKWDNLNGDVTLAQTISFSNSNYYVNRAKQIYP